MPQSQEGSLCTSQVRRDSNGELTWEKCIRQGLEMKCLLPALPLSRASSLLTFQELVTGVGYGFKILKKDKSNSIYYCQDHKT